MTDSIKVVVRESCCHPPRSNSCHCFWLLNEDNTKSRSFPFGIHLLSPECLTTDSCSTCNSAQPAASSKWIIIHSSWSLTSSNLEWLSYFQTFNDIENYRKKIVIRDLFLKKSQASVIQEETLAGDLSMRQIRYLSQSLFSL